MLVAIPSALWITSIHVPEPQRLALIWIVIVLNLFGHTTLMFFVRAPDWLRRAIGGWLAKHFDFYPGQFILTRARPMLTSTKAVNIEHKSMRLSLSFFPLALLLLKASLRMASKEGSVINASHFPHTDGSSLRYMSL